MGFWKSEPISQSLSSGSNVEIQSFVQGAVKESNKDIGYSVIHEIAQMPISELSLRFLAE